MYRHIRSPSRVSRGPTACLSRRFSVTARLQDYTATLSNLRIGKDTRVIFQGFTGKLATANAAESIAWGTKIVGGVKPGTTGEHLGLPILPTVRRAVEVLKPDASAIYVAAQHAASAIEEAIEAEVPLIVAVAEHIPLHDMLRVHSILKTQSKSRLVGPNSPGIISAVGRCRIGFQPLPCFSSGRVGIIAKSGTLSYETAASTTLAGLGQSLCVGIGGDIVPGTDIVEALKVLEHDEDTDAIALLGEIGGEQELEAASWIKDYRARVPSPKPIVGLIAGINDVAGHVMGHAGAITLPGEPTATDKIKALSAAGVSIVDHPSEIGQIIKSHFASGLWTKRPGSTYTGQTTKQQPRQMSSLSRTRRPALPPSQRRHPRHPRHLHLTGDPALDLLRSTDLPITPSPPAGSLPLIGLTIDRASRSPCIIASPAASTLSTKRFPFPYLTSPSSLPSHPILTHLNLPITSTTLSSLHSILTTLSHLFYTHEALLLTISLSISSNDTLSVSSPSFQFDPSATFRSTLSSHSTLATSDNSGMIYLPLPGIRRSVGTLVNGAGLAMNTIDALESLATNFLDTGGKATSDTVKRAFEIILQDERVKVVFVNIFGGLTKGDMIAEGVVKAVRELEIKVPVVVRIRGTREKEGREVIEGSGLGRVEAVGEFWEAVGRVRELVGEK